MKKRQLLSLIITVLLLCTLLPTLAFAAPRDDNYFTGNPTAVLSAGDTMINNYGKLEVVGATLTNNTSGGVVTMNHGDGTITNNFGTVTSNNGTVDYNFGTVDYNNGTVTNNFGTASVGGNVAPQHQFWEVTVTGGEHTTNDLTTANEKLWIEDGTSAVFAPASGYAITAASTDKGSIAKNGNGTWTLSGVTGTQTAAANVTLTVTAVPKTGVNRDTGVLTALALVSGIVLVTALPKKKTAPK